MNDLLDYGWLMQLLPDAGFMSALVGLTPADRNLRSVNRVMDGDSDGFSLDIEVADTENNNIYHS